MKTTKLNVFSQDLRTFKAVPAEPFTEMFSFVENELKFELKSFK